MKVFMTEGIIIGSIGTTLGVVTGLVFCLSLSIYGVRLDPEVYYIDRLPVAVSGSDYISVEIAAIVGPSGAGKSTLLHCIGTLDLPTSGRIDLAGEDITRLGAKEPGRLAALRNRTIGFVFQFHHLLPEFTALENVAMPGLVQGKARRELEPRASALLEE